MKNKPKFKIFRVFHSKKAQIAVSQAIKVITSIVLGGALLVGGVVTTNQIVLPNTSDKVTSMFGYEGEGGSGGGSISDNIQSAGGTLVNNGIVPEGCTYTVYETGEVLEVGDPLPEHLLSNDKLEKDNITYTLSGASVTKTESTYEYASMDELNAAREEFKVSYKQEILDALANDSDFAAEVGGTTWNDCLNYTYRELDISSENEFWDFLYEDAGLTEDRIAPSVDKIGSSFYICDYQDTDAQWSTADIPYEYKNQVLNTIFGYPVSVSRICAEDEFTTLTTKTWTGLSNFNGDYIWTDGINTYYSSGQNSYCILDGDTWTNIVWNDDLPTIVQNNINAYNIWTDGTNIYFSMRKTIISDNGASAYPAGFAYHYVWKGNNTWELKEWNGLTNFDGISIWTDGTNTYSSYYTEQYVLNGDTWEAKTWNGLTNFYGSNVWTDGTNYYYSGGSQQYILNGDTWEPKEWNGLTNFYGSNVWTDGTNYYYSNGINQYVLNGDTWEIKTWTGLTDFYGQHVWTDGTNYYYSYYTDQYVFS